MVQNLDLRPSPGTLADDSAIRETLGVLVGRYAFESGVVLVQIPQISETVIEAQVVQNRGYFAYPPHGLLYLGATLDGLGVPNVVLDLNIELLKFARNGVKDLRGAWQDALRSKIELFDGAFVCISFMFDSTFSQLRNVCDFVRREFPNSCIAVGGVGASADPAEIFNECNADIVFLNEGEIPLKQFYDYMRGTTDKLPDNLCLKNSAGGAVSTAKSTGGDVDLDIRPQYQKIGIGRYYQFGSLNNFSRMRGLDTPFATVLSRRGCRANCTFCSVRNFNGRSVRVRDPLGVVDEMEFLWREHGIRHFEWLDDDLLYDRENALQLFREISRRLPDATWCANNGLIAAAITPELLEAMADSNCQGFTVGLETGNVEMLRTVRKPATLERFMRFAAMSKSVPRIFYIVNFILGLPNENFSQMRDSLRVGMLARLDWVNFFTYQPLKNTDAFLAYSSASHEDPAAADELRRRGTTMNYNPVRAGEFKELQARDDIAFGWDVFDISDELIPESQQMKELWFTFNNLANFLRMPALFTDKPDRLRNAARWLKALETAYPDNPSITCLLFYLEERLGEKPRTELEAVQRRAAQGMQNSVYWRTRDREFSWSAFIDKQLPPIDRRAQAFIERNGIPMTDGTGFVPEALIRSRGR